MKFVLAALGLSATNAYTCSWTVDSWVKGGTAAASTCEAGASGNGVAAAKRYVYENVPMASCGSITPKYYATPAASATTDASASALNMMVHWCQPAVGWTASSTTEVQLGLLYYTTYAETTCATASTTVADSMPMQPEDSRTETSSVSLCPTIQSESPPCPTLLVQQLHSNLLLALLLTPLPPP